MGEYDRAPCERCAVEVFSSALRRGLCIECRRRDAAAESAVPPSGSWKRDY